MCQKHTEQFKIRCPGQFSTLHHSLPQTFQRPRKKNPRVISPSAAHLSRSFFFWCFCCCCCCHFCSSSIRVYTPAPMFRQTLGLSTQAKKKEKDKSVCPLHTLAQILSPNKGLGQSSSNNNNLQWCACVRVSVWRIIRNFRESFKFLTIVAFAFLGLTELVRKLKNLKVQFVSVCSCAKISEMLIFAG